MYIQVINLWVDNPKGKQYSRNNNMQCKRLVKELLKELSLIDFCLNEVSIIKIVTYKVMTSVGC